MPSTVLADRRNSASDEPTVSRGAGGQPVELLLIAVGAAGLLSTLRPVVSQGRESGSTAP